MAESVMFSGMASVRLTKSGKIDKRTKTGALIQKLVDDRVDEALRKNGIITDKDSQIKEPTPEEEAKKRRRNNKKWLVSQMGKAMLLSQAVSAGIRVQNAVASGDEAKQAREIFSSGTSAVTLALGTFGGTYGLVASVLLSYARGIFGQYIENSIQEKYDTKRLQYRLTNYDLSKYSTQTYNHSKDKWIASDIMRINKSVLGNTTIS